MTAIGPNGQGDQLQQNYPNPFNPSTEIAFTVARGGNAILRIYDVEGKLVTTLVDRNVEAGQHRIQWNGIDAQGRRVGSGIYFYRLSTPDFTQTRKMVLIK